MCSINIKLMCFAVQENAYMWEFDFSWLIEFLKACSFHSSARFKLKILIFIGLPRPATPCQRQVGYMIGTRFFVLYVHT